LNVDEDELDDAAELDAAISAAANANALGYEEVL
jgi:hypothetical protein